MIKNPGCILDHVVHNCPCPTAGPVCDLTVSLGGNIQPFKPLLCRDAPEVAGSEHIVANNVQTRVLEFVLIKLIAQRHPVMGIVSPNLTDAVTFFTCGARVERAAYFIIEGNLTLDILVKDEILAAGRIAFPGNGIKHSTHIAAITAHRTGKDIVRKMLIKRRFLRLNLLRNIRHHRQPGSAKLCQPAPSQLLAGASN